MAGQDGSTCQFFHRGGPTMSSGESIMSQAANLQKCLQQGGDAEWSDRFISSVTDKGRAQAAEILLEDLEKRVRTDDSGEEITEIARHLRTLRERQSMPEGTQLIERLNTMNIPSQVIRRSKVATEVAAWRKGDCVELTTLAKSLIEKWKDQLRASPGSKTNTARHLRNVATQIEKDLYTFTMEGNRKFSGRGARRPEEAYSQIFNMVRRLLRDPKRVKSLLDKSLSARKVVEMASVLPQGTRT
eukprot:GEMP01008877.1.p1 GENE.GEMP01008877.1~~GEMP01008877.1.p1  ORF type:complete len:244 (-),score=35.16 GEMP01008877.1:2735-3466(-)